MGLRALASGVGILLLAIAPARSDAQSCVGFPGLGGGARLTGALAFNKAAVAAGAGLTGGGATFGGVGVGLTSYDDRDGSSLDLSAAIGHEATTGSGGDISVCPSAGIGYSFGPNDILGEGVDSKALGLSAALSVGGRVTTEGTVGFIPFGSLAIVRSRVTLSADGESESLSETYGILALGSGVVFSDRYTIQPSILFPFGTDNGETTFRVAVSIRLGAR